MRLTARLRRLAVVLPLLWGCGNVQADEGVPALLQFAEQYRNQQPETPGVAEKKPAKTRRPDATPPAPGLSDSPERRRALRERGLQREQHQATIRKLEKEMSVLQQSLATATDKVPVSTDLAPLQALLVSLRQAVTGHPDEQHALALITQDREAQRQQVDEKTAAMVLLQQQLTAQQQENQSLQKHQTTLQRQADNAAAELVKQTQTLQQLQADTEILRVRAKWLAKAATLAQPAGQQAYAAGTALGRDILAMLNERKAWGVNTDPQTLLAGVVDTFAGQYQLTTDVLARALADSEAAVNAARETVATVQHKTGEAYVADFKKKKGVKHSPSGFWYRVDYAGDEPIADDAVVDVVVKEKLTDGTVIQDMEVSGKVLSQPLSAYPALFQEAIGYLQNHGSLTLVVPPALAYGEVGYPPKVPPNATMVYELRVENSKIPQ